MTTRDRSRPEPIRRGSLPAKSGTSKQQVEPLTILLSGGSMVVAAATPQMWLEDQIGRLGAEALVNCQPWCCVVIDIATFCNMLQ